MKKCTKCGEEKPLCDFNKKGGALVGLRADCKECVRKRDHSPEAIARRAAYKASARGRAKLAAYEASPEGIAKRREYHTSERGRRLKIEYAKTDAGRASFAKSHKRFRQSERGREYAREFERRLYRESAQHRLAKLLRNRVRGWLKGRHRISAITNLGCSVEDAVKHIEAGFSSGMSWDNHGEWHIDHIRPLASFDLTDESQVALACHYTNLQPLWGKENQSKGARELAAA